MRDKRHPRLAEIHGSRAQPAHGDNNEFHHPTPRAHDTNFIQQSRPQQLAGAGGGQHQHHHHLQRAPVRLDACPGCEQGAYCTAEICWPLSQLRLNHGVVPAESKHIVKRFKAVHDWHDTRASRGLCTPDRGPRAGGMPKWYI